MNILLGLIVTFGSIIAGCVIAVQYQMWRIERVESRLASLARPTAGAVAGARRS